MAHEATAAAGWYPDPTGSAAGAAPTDVGSALSAVPDASRWRASFLGIPLDACDEEQLVETVERWIAGGDHRYAVGINAHVVNLAHDDPEFRAALQHSGLNYADGQAIVWAARLLGLPIRRRVATTDTIHPLAASWARCGRPVYLLGGRPGVAQAAADRLVQRHPDLRIAGTYHGYFGDDEDEAVVGRVNCSGAQVLLVGFGNPRQETWARRHLAELTPNAVLTCGGLFDWVSGRNRVAPAWMSRIGLEWLYRLAIEPRRLFKRYVVGNPRFVLRVARALLRRAGRARGGRGGSLPP